MSREKGLEHPALCSEGTLGGEEGRSHGTHRPRGCPGRCPSQALLSPALPAPSPLAVESNTNLSQLKTAPVLLLLPPEKPVACPIISRHIRSPPAALARAPSLSIPTSATTAGPGTGTRGKWEQDPTLGCSLPSGSGSCSWMDTHRWMDTRTYMTFRNVSNSVHGSLWK